MTKRDTARWWDIRRAQNRKPATYRCPLCGGYLPALSEHMLIVAEGDPSRRRHAHTQCVAAAREAGRLPMHREWLASRRASERDGGRASERDRPPSSGHGRRAGRAVDRSSGWRRVIARLGIPRSRS